MIKVEIKLREGEGYFEGNNRKNLAGGSLSD